jgi:hypothetical protein
MKRQSSFFRSKGAWCAILIVLTGSSANADELKLSDLGISEQARAEALAKLNAALASDNEAAATTLQSPSTVITVGLRGATLQPATGLHSAAAGLTPTEAWRRVFPHKE